MGARLAGAEIYSLRRHRQEQVAVAIVPGWRCRKELLARVSTFHPFKLLKETNAK